MSFSDTSSSGSKEKPTTYKQFGYSDTHSSFDVYYDVSRINPCDYYTIVVEDFAENRKKEAYLPEVAY